MSPRVLRVSLSAVILAFACAACSDANESPTGQQDDHSGHIAADNTEPPSPGAGAAATNEAASGGTGGLDGSNPQTPQQTEFEERLAAVDLLMEYGYGDEPVLYALSKAAGHAGTAQCMCSSPDWNSQLLAGCALDEALPEFDGLPIDYEVAMRCVIEEVGRSTVIEYAECVTELLLQQTQCYGERQGSDECRRCEQDFEACPGSQAVGALEEEVCSPYLGLDPPPRSRRIVNQPEPAPAE